MTALHGITNRPPYLISGLISLGVPAIQRLASAAQQLMLVLLCLGPLQACDRAQQQEDYFPPPLHQGGWRVNTSEEFVTSLGLDHAALSELARYTSLQFNSSITGYDYHNHSATLVIKDGWIVGEWYSAPEYQAFQQYLSSNGKSFAYVLFGLLMQEAAAGRLPVRELSEKSRLYDPAWLHEGYPLSDPRKAAITFEQVFRHTAGLMPEQTADGVPMEYGRYQWTRYVDWVVGHDPAWPQTGQLFFDPGRPEQYAGSEVWGNRILAYSSIGFAHLGIAFYHMTGHSAHGLLWHYLLEPIGFRGVSYHHPPAGFPHRWFTAGGLRMTARDYARFCYLLLRKGRWQGRQLVDEQWLERAFTTPHYPNLRSNVDGYLGSDLPRDTLRIFGSGGNFAYIIPSLDLIVLHCGRMNNTLAKKLEQDLLNRLRMILAPRATPAPPVAQDMWQLNTALLDPP